MNQPATKTQWEAFLSARESALAEYQEGDA